jgi:hypothetical protein
MALVVVLSVAVGPSARSVTMQAQADPLVANQDMIQAAVDALAAPVPPRVRGFNTAQLLDWLNDDGKTPKPIYVTCPVATADVTKATQFGCAVAMMGASGSKLHRLIVFWSDLEPDNPLDNSADPQQFEKGWTKYQTVIDALANVGVTEMIITPVGSPNWARESTRHTAMEGVLRYAHPDVVNHLEDWKNFVEELARHVAPVGFEIGNEQNTTHFWDPINNPPQHTPEKPSPTEWGQLYCGAVEGISRVSPTALVGVGGLAAIRKTNKSGGSMEASEFLAQSMSPSTGVGVGKGMCRLNFVGYHPYLTNDYCTANPPIQQTRGIAELRLVRDVMTRNSHSHQKIWITEWGFPSRHYESGGRTCTRYSAAEQARLIKLEHEYLARLPYTAFSGYFNLVDDDTPSQNGSIGLVCSDFTVKRSFNTWHQLRPAAPGGLFATGACHPVPSPPPEA